MSMIQGIVRAITAALVVLIAVLVYVNYFRSTDTGDISGSRSELAVAPELPRIAVAPEAPVPPAPPVTPPAVLQGPANAPDSARATQTVQPEASRPAAPSRPARAETRDDNALAEIVELPPVNNPRASPNPPPVEMPIAAPKSPGASSVKRTHIVQPGDSLWLISKKLYGNAELYSKIADANGINAKDRVRVGQVLVIPDLNGPSEPITAHSAPIIEDFDHEDTPRTLHVSSTKEAPATMNSTVKRP